MVKWLWCFVLGFAWLAVTFASSDQKVMAREGTNAGMAHAFEADWKP